MVLFQSVFEREPTSERTTLSTCVIRPWLNGPGQRGDCPVCLLLDSHALMVMGLQLPRKQKEYLFLPHIKLLPE